MRVDEAALAKIFPRLADVDEQGGPVRKRARLDAFGDAERALVNRLVDERLLLTDKDDAHVPWVTPTHEAVLRHWSRLAKWLSENKAFLLWRKRLKVFREGRGLLQGEELGEALSWYKRYAAGLDPAERNFIQKSRRRRRLRRVLMGVMMPVGTGLLGLAIYAGYLGWIWSVTEFNLWRIQNDWIAPPPEPVMITVPAGEFQMGSVPANDPEARPDEAPQHRVEFSKPFQMGAYEVTFEQYDTFIQLTGRVFNEPGDNAWGRDKRPVINVSWDDAKAYAEFLSRANGKSYRLPTEAEWEYAARAGTSTRYWWGDVVGKNNANCFECGSQWDGKQTAPVGSFPPNPFGLHDMNGNVWEWVEDCVHGNYEGAPADGTAWKEAQGGDCGPRVVRGGSWYNHPDYVRAGFRSGDNPAGRINNLGFRLAKTF